MNKNFLKEGLGWGILLWFIGYVLGIILFFIMPPDKLGWVIMPIGIVLTLWVCLRKIQAKDLSYYVKIAIIWTVIAVIFDYFFLVLLIKPEDGYYKLDVYLYYLFTFLLPLAAYFWKTNKS